MLQREVEPPRTSASVWLPMMALVSAAMLTIVSGIAVMTRQPQMRREVRIEQSSYVSIEPSIPIDELRRLARQREIGRLQELAKRRLEQARGERCAAKVRRALADGDVMAFEDCGTAVQR